MQLRGWDYTGRNIGPELHRQFKIITDCLSDPHFVGESDWGKPVQEKLAMQIAASSGTVRTVKKICDDFGFIAPRALEARKKIDCDGLLTDRGKLVYHAATLELQVQSNAGLDASTKKAAIAEIKKLYEEAYCDALTTYHFTNADGSKFYPLRATLRALKKYQRLDKWEWYLLNTYVRHNDDAEEEAVLDEYINNYRAGLYSFTMQDVVEKPKGHQYTPQYFEFAGLLHVIQRPLWFICDSDRYNEIKEEVLSDTFLENI